MSGRVHIIGAGLAGLAAAVRLAASGLQVALYEAAPRAGGRWYTLHEGGKEAVVGHVRAWEPPSRFVFSWEISAEWQSDASVASEVEVLFVAEGPNSTRVTLEHRNFEALGAEGGEKMRGEVGGGWPTILDMFKTEAEKHHGGTP